MQPLPGSAEFPNDNPLLHQGAVWICTRVRGSPRAILRASLPPPEPGPEPEPEREASPVPVFVCAPVPLGLPEPELVPTSVSEPVVAEPGASPVPVFVCAPVPLGLSEPEATRAPLADAEPVPVVEPAPVPLVAATSEPEFPPSVVEPPRPYEPPPANPEDSFADYVQAVVEVVLEAGSTRAAAAVPELLSGTSVSIEAFDRAAVDRLVAQGLAERAAAAIVLSASFRTTVGVWQRVLRGEPADLSECGGSMLDQWTADFVATLLGAPALRSDDLRRQLRRKGVAAFGMLARAA